jgi:diadenosine tetraphosphate (Ap4A) HIT family hydrolase
MHVHFHLIPREPGDSLGYRWPAGQYPEGRLEEIRDRVSAALKRTDA